MHFLGIFIPIVYVYGILRQSSTQSVYTTIFIGFLVGLTMDMFSNTPGLHAAATTLMGFMRYPVLRLFVLKEDMSNKYISSSWMGKGTFWKYSLILVLIHHTTLFLLESLTFFNLFELLLKIVVCSLLTMLFIFAMEFINNKGNARRP
jgi:rod shape-determining protein MreD